MTPSKLKEQLMALFKMVLGFVVGIFIGVISAIAFVLAVPFYFAHKCWRENIYPWEFY